MPGFAGLQYPNIGAGAAQWEAKPPWPGAPGSHPASGGIARLVDAAGKLFQQASRVSKNVSLRRPDSIKLGHELGWEREKYNIFTTAVGGSFCHVPKARGNTDFCADGVVCPYPAWACHGNRRRRKGPRHFFAGGGIGTACHRSSRLCCSPNRN